jgi:hypothetical protein
LNFKLVPSLKGHQCNSKEGFHWLKHK